MSNRPEICEVSLISSLSEIYIICLNSNETLFCYILLTLSGQMMHACIVKHCMWNSFLAPIINKYDIWYLVGYCLIFYKLREVFHKSDGDLIIFV